MSALPRPCEVPVFRHAVGFLPLRTFAGKHGQAVHEVAAPNPGNLFLVDTGKAHAPTDAFKELGGHGATAPAPDADYQTASGQERSRIDRKSQPA